MSRIALINLSTLERIAVIGEIDRLSDASYTCHNDFLSFRKDAERVDGFVVGETDFIRNLDYFLPRKSKTIVIVSSNVNRDQYNPEDGSIKMIGRETEIPVISEMIMELVSHEETEEHGELSFREKEVLRELASGKTNKEIGDRLCISVNTVITHRKNISAKLGIRSVSGLSLYAMMNGII